eukprot:687885-Alexandrium_andersonii.AAC.1
MAPAAASICAASTSKSCACPSAPQPPRPWLGRSPIKSPLMYSRVSSATNCAHGFTLCLRTASSPVAILLAHKAAPSSRRRRRRPARTRR